MYRIETILVSESGGFYQVTLTEAELPDHSASKGYYDGSGRNIEEAITDALRAAEWPTGRRG